MKTNYEIFNPSIESDVLAYRIVQKFMQCLKEDEWFIKSTENIKIIALYPPKENEINVAVNTLNQKGYSCINKSTYYAGPINAIWYFPNPVDKIKEEKREYAIEIWFLYKDGELSNPTDEDLKLLSIMKEQDKKGVAPNQFNFDSLWKSVQ